MTSYGDIIKQGRTETVGKEVNTEVGKTVNAESGKTVNTEVGKAHSSSEAEAVKAEDKPTPDPERAVNITIKVPRKSRQYWTAQCKLQGVTMTEVLVQALTQRFGEPPSQ